jgi:hypothetical protein
MKGKQGWAIHNLSATPSDELYASSLNTPPTHSREANCHDHIRTISMANLEEHKMSEIGRERLADKK